MMYPAITGFKAELVDNVKSPSISPREQFCAVVSNGPLAKADAIVVLSGDGETRYRVATGLLQQQGAPVIVVSGGLDKPPHSLTAETAAKLLISFGVAHDRIILEGRSQNTYEEAENVVRMARHNRWKAIILVTSPYHQYRAYLSFVKSVYRAKREKKLRLVNAPASHVQWWRVPDGLDVTRLDLLAGEFQKIADLQKRGHCATYEQGLAYLKLWEGA